MPPPTGPDRKAEPAAPPPGRRGDRLGPGAGPNALGLLGSAPSKKVSWIAMADVPPLQEFGTSRVWLTVPASELAAIGKGLSKHWYRVMVDNLGAVKEGATTKSPGETDNRSWSFSLMEGPYIQELSAASDILAPGEFLKIRALVFGSSRWTWEKK